MSVARVAKGEGSPHQGLCRSLVRDAQLVRGHAKLRRDGGGLDRWSGACSS